MTTQIDKNENYYAKLAKIDMSPFMEQKGKFNYVSWVHAVDQLKRFDPTATWDTLRHNGLPYIKSDCGYFVEVAVTVKGITHSQIHPVLNNGNKPIVQPNAFEINTAIQRCLVKAIALHGLGLYVYAGEDLPFEIEEKISNRQLTLLENKVAEFAQLRGKTEDDVYLALRLNPNDLEDLTEIQGHQHLDVVTSWIKKASDEPKVKPDEKLAETAAK